MRTATSSAAAKDRPELPSEGIELELNLLGRYSLASRLDAMGNRREFACRVMSMSTDAMTLAAPSVGPIGERAIIHLDPFGKLQGRIVRVHKHGFAIRIAATEAERERIAAKLAWLEKHRNADVADARRFGRSVPRQPIATLTMPGGITMSCLVMDISASGAAVSADYIPNLGMRLSLGQINGRVVRRFEEGFAIEFDHLMTQAGLEQSLSD